MTEVQQIAEFFKVWEPFQGLKSNEDQVVWERKQ